MAWIHVPQLESEPEVNGIWEIPEEAPFTIPEKWKWARLGDVTTFNPKISLSDELEATFLPMAAISAGYENKIDVNEKRIWKNVKNRYSKFADGDIIMAKITPCFQNLKSSICKNLHNGIGAGSTEFHVIRPKTALKVEYLLIFLKSPYLIKYGIENFKGTAGQQRVGTNDLRKCLIPLPPLGEQQRIVSIVRHLRSDINLYRQEEEQLERMESAFPEKLRASILQEAIRGKLVPQLESEPCIELPDSQVSDNTIDIPKKWKWVKLKDIFTFIDYRGKTPNKIQEGVRLITASNIKQGRMDHSKKVFISNEEYLTRQSRGISKKGDILFTTEAPLGNVAIADIDNYSAGQRIITLHSKKGNNKLYMYFMLSPYFQKLLISQATGTTAQGIKAARLKELAIPVPPEGEQERILNKLTDLFSFLEIYKQA